MLGLDPGRFLFPDLLGYGNFGGFAPLDRVGVNLPDQVLHLRQRIQAVFGDEPVFLVGHSTGAAAAFLYAHRFPTLVAGLVSAEGNLSGADAFLSARLAAKSPAEMEHWLADARSRPEDWMHLERVKITPDSKQLMIEWLDYQPGPVIQAMARSVVTETFAPHYADMVARVMNDIPTHLVLGSRSQSISAVPPRFRALAKSFSVIPDASHLMMVDAPDAFQAIVRNHLPERASRVKEPARLSEGNFEERISLSSPGPH